MAWRADSGSSFRHYGKEQGLEREGDSYVCVSTVRDETPLRRRKGDCLTTCVIMLDDIGTKVAEPPVAPTAIIETSQGNFQYVYRIEPIDSKEHWRHYEACVQRLADKKFTDAGAVGVNRVFRIPGSINTKRDEPWVSRVTSWSPERVWTLDALMKEFGQAVAVPAEFPEPDRAYFVPDEDPVLVWLGEHNLISAERDEWHIVECPWAEEHSGNDTTAAYSALGSGDKPYMRGFKCLHEHCALRKVSNFLAWVAANDGPQVGATAPVEDLGKLVGNLSGITVDEKYRLLTESLPELSAFNLPDLRKTKSGPKESQLCTSTNVAHVLESSGVDAVFNMQSRDTELQLRDESLLGLVPNEHAIKRQILDSCLRLGIQNMKQIETIVVERSLNRRFHPMAGWIKELEWDGRSRLNELAGSVQVAQDDETLWPVFLRKWLIQGVQAVFGWEEPRQIGSVLVFTGNQRIGKSLWFASLVPKGFFTPSARLSLSFGYKDSVMAATRTAVTELGELDSTFKKSDTGALKAFLSADHDTYRPPYGALTLRIPRATVFCATVNRVDFLMDETGSSRYWPTEVVHCDPEHGVNIQQLWAEALTWWLAGEEWWLTPEEANRHKEHSDNYRVSTFAEDSFNQYLSKSVDQAAEEYVPMNVTMLMGHLNIPKMQPHIGTMVVLLNKQFGSRRTVIKNVRNAWLMPDPAKIMGLAPEVTSW